MSRSTSEESLVAVAYALTDCSLQLELVVTGLYEWGSRHRTRHAWLARGR